MTFQTGRVEKDFLGEKEVPGNAYYGIQTIRATENFPITKERMHPELIRAIGIVKRAAAISNVLVNDLPKDIGLAIVEASDEVIAGTLTDQFIVDPIQGGAGTSFNMNANEVIANRALEIMGREKGDYDYISPNNHINMSQSTNDAFPTAIKIATQQLVNQLLETMDKFAAELKMKEQEFDGVIKMGRTHLQDAVPIRLGQEFSAYRSVIERDIERIGRTRIHLSEINMGATAIGTGLNANAQYIETAVEHLREISGLPLESAANLIDSTQNTDVYTELSSALKICMINLSKMANDLRLMASGPRAGLNEINLPARQPGSSIMPGKVNPVMAEVMNQIAFQVIGNDHTISLASEAGQFELNVMEPVLVYNLLQSLTVMNNGIEVFRKYCISGITANVEQMQNYVERSLGTITALTPYIGYEMSSKIARESFETGVPLKELCLHYNVLTADELNKLLDPYQMTEMKREGVVHS
ncbi:aspartate ammonia-lyase [Sporosarcina thermotolerans]|uniref:Aspartate ammonia-lyase n=1 Tax=Sporosarcina thermotolerans TaxID=633404 RepID=A0AAW9AEV0_9BACL|nr:aspartate ammonia-lyase [Sporosarcina thermotolerans]MDW0117678.1 aspartate ammonia-lyase [Sporosarcina thermotolerans]WHT49233.1 aspartate ammonia-lyase [Sporosarcina thermotolerans]